MESRPVAAEVFNDIPLIEEQITVTREDLARLGVLFILHGMHRLFAAGLLHRHVQLPDHHGLIHEQIEQQDFCRLTDLTTASEISPHSYFVNPDGRLQPYEYQRGPCKATITEAFARDLSSFLRSKRLERVVSVVPRPVPEQHGLIELETLLPNGAGMHTATYKKEDLHLSAGEEIITTSWTFDTSPASGAEFAQTATRVGDRDDDFGTFYNIGKVPSAENIVTASGHRCIRWENGVHKRFYDHAAFTAESAPIARGTSEDLMHRNGIDQWIFKEQIPTAEDIEITNGTRCLKYVNGVHQRTYNHQAAHLEGNVDTQHAKKCIKYINGMHQKIYDQDRALAEVSVDTPSAKKC